MDLLWGNGESLLRVLLSGAVAVGIAAAVLVNSTTNQHYFDAFAILPDLWGLTAQPTPLALAVALTMSRFVLFGLFMAILVKRLSRR